MEPTDDVVRRRSGRGPGPFTAENREGGLESEPPLTDLVAEVVRRDPTIADLDSPGAAGRLQTAVSALATERSLRAALTEVQRLEATRQAERERRLAEEEQRQLAKAEEERRRQEGEDKARREKEERAARIAAMKPVPKWLATHPAAVSAVAIAAVFALAVWAVVATPAQESSSPAPTQARLTAAPAPPAGGPINSQTEWAPGFRGVYAELEASDDWSVSAAATATMFTWEVGTDCSGRACVATAATLRAIGNRIDQATVTPRFTGDGFHARTSYMSKCDGGGTRKLDVTRDYTPTRMNAGVVTEFRGTVTLRWQRSCGSDVPIDETYNSVLRLS